MMELGYTFFDFANSAAVYVKGHSINNPDGSVTDPNAGRVSFPSKLRYAEKVYLMDEFIVAANAALRKTEEAHAQ